MTSIRYNEFDEEFGAPRAEKKETLIEDLPKDDKKHQFQKI